MLPRARKNQISIRRGAPLERPVVVVVMSGFFGPKHTARDQKEMSH